MNTHLLSGEEKARKTFERTENGNIRTTASPVPRQYTQGYVNPTPELTTYGGIKLGWIQGVLIPCLLNIWGVMLFLRIAWVVAQAGIALTICIIFLSGVVCVITTLSLSAICTNGQLQGGGVYYIVSRTLGAELGASVGIIFAFANAVAASMNTIGFCDSLNELLKSKGLKIIDNDVNDVRIVGAIALLLMCVICAVGMDWESKTQNFLIVVIVLAIINYVIGALIGPRTDIEKAQGFEGINMERTVINWLPDFRYSEGQFHDFFSVFAMYFPAVTGVQAGANICGDLKDPATAIPKGTLLALAISITSYLTMAVLCGVGAMRDASGIVAHLHLGPDAISACKPNCEYGLHNNYEIMQLMAFWGPLIYGGCWAATLSTALTNLLSVPRLIQALGVDRIYPGLIFFSKPYGRHGEPYRGYVLTFFVSLMFLLIADLNKIAPLITNFYLASYALINFCTFHAAFVHQISWRPTFKYYNTWLSLAGFLMCLIIMMVISWVMALVTVLIFITLYLLVVYSKPDASWGSSTDAQRYQEIIARILHISHNTEHIKSYNPQLLVLAGTPYMRPTLLDIGNLIIKNGSFMVVADIHHDALSQAEREGYFKLGNDWLIERKHRAFFVLLDGISFEGGAIALMQSTGFGRLSPNIVLLGYKHDWIEIPSEILATYVRVIQHAFDHKLAVAILRAPDDYILSKGRPPLPPPLPPPSPPPSAVAGFSGAGKTNTETNPLLNADSEFDLSEEDLQEIITSVKSQAKITPPSQVMSEMSIHKQNTYNPIELSPQGNLDAWWLYDDGGLNILLPYIIARRNSKEKMCLRIFALAKETVETKNAQESMEVLLAKFRIDYTELNLLHAVNEQPKEETWSFFNSLVITSSDIEEEMRIQRSKTIRYLRIRELLLQHSTTASLIVMTLPKPRKGSVSPTLYMAWLEVLSRDLPPMLFVRGNDNSVLDF